MLINFLIIYLIIIIIIIIINLMKQQQTLINTTTTTTNQSKILTNLITQIQRILNHQQTKSSKSTTILSSLLTTSNFPKQLILIFQNFLIPSYARLVSGWETQHELNAAAPSTTIRPFLPPIGVLAIPRECRGDPQDDLCQYLVNTVFSKTDFQDLAGNACL
jgi:hypothetical protein